MKVRDSRELYHPFEIGLSCLLAGLRSALRNRLPAAAVLREGQVKGRAAGASDACPRSSISRRPSEGHSELKARRPVRILWAYDPGSRWRGLPHALGGRTSS